ncbi:MAG: hypothetical protein Q8R54_02095, partial [Methylobacter sp.]|nr:hypothetical protein [Methylobacter sp.]
KSSRKSCNAILKRITHRNVGAISIVLDEYPAIRKVISHALPTTWMKAVIAESFLGLSQSIEPGNRQTG